MTAPDEPTASGTGRLHEAVPGERLNEGREAEAHEAGDVGPWQRLHPLSLVHEAASAVPSLALLLLPAWLGIVGSGRVVSALALGAASLLVGTPLLVARHLRTRYRLTGTGIEVESGVFARQHRVLPYERVQGVEIERPALARLLGTARVHVMTGSGQGVEATLAYVSVAEAERMRRVLRDAHASAVPSAGPAVAGDAAPAAPVADVVRFRLTTRRLVQAGLYRVSLAWLAVAYSALQVTGLEPIDLVDVLAGDRLAAWRASAETHPVVGGALVATAALGLAWLAGVVTTVLRFAGFVVTDDGRRLHTSGGLVSRWTRTLPHGRVQAFVQRSVWPMRRAGVVRLDAQMLGTSAEGVGASLDTLAPLVPVAEADALVAAIRPLAPIAVWEAPSPLHRRRLAIRYTVAAVVLLGLWPLVGVWALAGVAAGVALGRVAAVAQARAHRYALTADALHVEHGAFWRTRRSVPRDRVQGVSRQATWMQRRRGLATVVVDTAGGPGLGLRVRDLDAAAASALVADVRRGISGVRRVAEPVAVADEAEVEHGGHGLAERRTGEVDDRPADG